MNWWTSIEITRQRLQEQIDAQNPDSERNRLGQFATPFTLARQIVSVAQNYQELPIGEVRFLEPAVGSGSFYSALLDATGGACPAAAVGFEIDTQLADLAKQLWHTTGLHVHTEDFTSTLWPADEKDKFNLLVTNPPYVRHHHLPQAQKERLGELVSSQIGLKPSGLMGLYGYFLLLSHDWMQKNGVAGWLVPTEFMDVGYGTVLKEYLLSRVELLRVHRFDAHNAQFTDAYVTSAVLFLRNNLPVKDHKVEFSTGPDLENPQSRDFIPIQKLRNIRKWTAIGQRPLHKLGKVQASSQAVTLGDLFNVKRGLATGANHFFIMTRREAKQKGIPERFLKPVLPSPRYLRSQTIIESDSAGFPLVEPRLVLFNCAVPKDQLAERHPELYRYILQGEEEGLHERYLLSRRDPWYRQEKRAPTPILCGYMARKNESGESIRFYRNKSQAIATNVYLMLYPKPIIAQSSEDLEVIFDRVFELLLSLNQGDVTYHGRTYGGGLDKIEPKELQRVVLPCVDDIEELAPLSHLLVAEQESGKESTELRQTRLPMFE
ncbi:MAG: Eco57I restriction-modification methylase domain-containing protein [Candidatus Binatia bacterium]